MSSKVVVFDMDGTLADFYGVEGWLSSLAIEDTKPYEVAKPLFSMNALLKQMRKMKRAGWVFKIVSWGSKQSSNDFLKRTETAKLEWLRRYGLLDEIDSVQVVPYGVPKHEISSGILFDDNETICNAWAEAGGRAVNVTQENLMDVLKHL